MLFQIAVEIYRDNNFTMSDYYYHDRTPDRLQAGITQTIPLQEHAHDTIALLGHYFENLPDFDTAPDDDFDNDDDAWNFSGGMKSLLNAPAQYFKPQALTLDLGFAQPSPTAMNLSAEIYTNAMQKLNALNQRGPEGVYKKRLDNYQDKLASQAPSNPYRVPDNKPPSLQNGYVAAERKNISPAKQPRPYWMASPPPPVKSGMSDYELRELATQNQGDVGDGANLYQYQNHTPYVYDPSKMPNWEIPEPVKALGTVAGQLLDAMFVEDFRTLLSNDANLNQKLIASTWIILNFVPASKVGKLFKLFRFAKHMCTAEKVLWAEEKAHALLYASRPGFIGFGGKIINYSEKVAAELAKLTPLYEHVGQFDGTVSEILQKLGLNDAEIKSVRSSIRKTAKNGKYESKIYRTPNENLLIEITVPGNKNGLAKYYKVVDKEKRTLHFKKVTYNNEGLFEHWTDMLERKANEPHIYYKQPGDEIKYFKILINE